MNELLFANGGLSPAQNALFITESPFQIFIIVSLRIKHTHTNLYRSPSNVLCIYDEIFIIWFEWLCKRIFSC